jgi:hypothetical protein
MNKSLKLSYAKMSSETMKDEGNLSAVYTQAVLEQAMEIANDLFNVSVKAKLTELELKVPSFQHFDANLDVRLAVRLLQQRTDFELSVRNAITYILEELLKCSFKSQNELANVSNKLPDVSHRLPNVSHRLPEKSLESETQPSHRKTKRLRPKIPAKIAIDCSLKSEQEFPDMSNRLTEKTTELDRDPRHRKAKRLKQNILVKTTTASSDNYSEINPEGANEIVEEIPVNNRFSLLTELIENPVEITSELCEIQKSTARPKLRHFHSHRKYRRVRKNSYQFTEGDEILSSHSPDTRLKDVSNIDSGFPDSREFLTNSEDLQLNDTVVNQNIADEICNSSFIDNSELNSTIVMNSTELTIVVMTEESHMDPQHLETTSTNRAVQSPSTSFLSMEANTESTERTSEPTKAWEIADLAIDLLAESTVVQGNDVANGLKQLQVTQEIFVPRVAQQMLMQSQVAAFEKIQDDASSDFLREMSLLNNHLGSKKVAEVDLGSSLDALDPIQSNSMQMQIASKEKQSRLTDISPAKNVQEIDTEPMQQLTYMNKIQLHICMRLMLQA